VNPGLAGLTGLPGLPPGPGQPGEPGVSSFTTAAAMQQHNQLFYSQMLQLRQQQVYLKYIIHSDLCYGICFDK
jgi:hypothetical protein